MTESEVEPYGAWLSGYAWTHWITLTVDPAKRKRMGRAGRCPRSPEAVQRAFRNEFVRYTEKVSGQRVPFAYAVEKGVGGDNPHIHALLCVQRAMRVDRLREAWRHGRSTIEDYDPARGAAFYLSKTFGREGAEWDVSRTLPPLAATESRREHRPYRSTVQGLV